MPRLTRPPFSTYLDRIFRTRGETAWPQHVSDLVSLTHEWFAGTSAFDNYLPTSDAAEVGFVFEVLNVPGATTNATSAATPDGFYDVLLACSVDHTDAASHDLTIGLSDTDFGAVVNLAFGARTANQCLALDRTIIMPRRVFVLAAAIPDIPVASDFNLQTLRLRLIPGMKL